MKKLSYWLWPLMISACGLPHKPQLDRRDHTRTADESISGPDAQGSSDGTLSPEDLMRDKEEVEVLNQTMKERYRSARGVDLRSSRVPLGPGMETATLRSYQSLIDKLSWSFGRAATDIPLDDPSTFTISRALQNDSPNYGVSAYRLFANAVSTLCRGLVAANTAKFNAAPTADSLAKQCNEWSERFWLRSMNAAEMQICMNTGLEVTKAVSSAQERWGQICSVVATAPQFVIVDAPQTASPSTGASGGAGTATGTANIVGDANTGRQLFTASCSGCHGGNRPVRARTEAAMQAASTNMNHIGREAYLLPPKNATSATEFHHILAYLKSLGG